VPPEKAKSLTMPHEKRLGLNNQEGLPPGSNGSRQKHEQDAIALPEAWPCDLSAKNDELLS
jgi:hypothetical protein